MTLNEFRSLNPGDLVATADRLEVPGTVVENTGQYVKIQWEGGREETFDTISRIGADYNARQLRRRELAAPPAARRKRK